MNHTPAFQSVIYKTISWLEVHSSELQVIFCQKTTLYLQNMAHIRNIQTPGIFDVTLFYTSSGINLKILTSDFSWKSLWERLSFHEILTIITMSLFVTFLPGILITYPLIFTAVFFGHCLEVSYGAIIFHTLIFFCGIFTFLKKW